MSFQRVLFSASTKKCTIVDTKATTTIEDYEGLHDELDSFTREARGDCSERAAPTIVGSHAQSDAAYSSVAIVRSVSQLLFACRPAGRLNSSDALQLFPMISMLYTVY